MKALMRKMNKLSNEMINKHDVSSRKGKKAFHPPKAESFRKRMSGFTSVTELYKLREGTERRFRAIFFFSGID